jgi:hypothetical protein
MNLDVLVDDEFHTPIPHHRWQEGQLKRTIRIADVEHDLRGWPRMLAGSYASLRKE